MATCLPLLGFHPPGAFQGSFRFPTAAFAQQGPSTSQCCELRFRSSEGRAEERTKELQDLHCQVKHPEWRPAKLGPVGAGGRK